MLTYSGRSLVEIKNRVREGYLYQEFQNRKHPYKQLFVDNLTNSAQMKAYCDEHYQKFVFLITFTNPESDFLTRLFDLGFTNSSEFVFSSLSWQRQR